MSNQPKTPPASASAPTSQPVTVASSASKAPPHLSAATSRWFDDVLVEYALEPHHLRLLTLAAEAWDRCTQAREAVAEHGLTYVDRFNQPRARPEVAIERDSRIAFARLLRELALDVSEPGESRPPAITGKASLRSDEWAD